jgi:hypothetical protein
MKFSWEVSKNNSLNIYKETQVLKEDTTKKDQICSAYNATYSPTCTKRGKHNKEVRLCWDTIKNLRYDGENFIIGSDIYQILECIICEDYYIEKSEQNINRKVDIFKCFECYEKENR